MVNFHRHFFISSTIWAPIFHFHFVVNYPKRTLCSFALWRSPKDLHCLLSKQQVDNGDMLEILRSSSGGSKQIHPKTTQVIW